MCQVNNHPIKYLPASLVRLNLQCMISSLRGARATWQSIKISLQRLDCFAALAMTGQKKAKRRGNPEHITFITRLLRFARNDVSALVCSLLLFLPVVAFSLNSNQQKTAYISSDHSNYNRITHVSTYSGHVHYTQGTSELNADKVVIYDDLKTNKVYKIVAFGDRAEYITLPDGKKEKLHALAKTIEYYPQKNIAILITNAEITQGGETIKGARITYDITKDTILLKPTTKKRAIITFQP